MQVTGIRFSRKISERPDLGVMKYESAELELTGVVTENEEPSEAIKGIKYQVEFHLGLNPIKPAGAPIPSGTPADSVPHGGKSEETKKETTTDKKAEAAAKKAEAAAKKKEEAAKKKAEKEAAKVVPYDRENKAHRDEFAAILSDRVPNWKEHASVAKALSVTLNGTPIFDSKGEILGSFTDAIVEGMKEATAEEDL